MHSRNVVSSVSRFWYSSCPEMNSCLQASTIFSLILLNQLLNCRHLAEFSTIMVSFKNNLEQFIGIDFVNESVT
uniref:Secreted protein n=1 Tax=Mesocestoides corti TaxID=53468 RepID=A0A5K3FEF5_MESCO